MQKSFFSYLLRPDSKILYLQNYMERIRFTLEYLFKASPTILYQFLTDPPCLIRWFCDEVDVHGDLYTFRWGEAEETAYVVDDFQEELLRLHWESAESEDEHLEFKIFTSDVTDETILHISDYCDPGEEEDQQRYWDALIARLRAVCGG